MLFYSEMPDLSIIWWTIGALVAYVNWNTHFVLPVIEAANGFQAWKILEDLTNHIDLVLTEVIMPFLSGIVLLSKIMSHKTRKNVPVISKFSTLFCFFVDCYSIFILAFTLISFEWILLTAIFYEISCSDVISWFNGYSL